VTLCIGIITTVFTAVFCTRVVYDYLLSQRRLATLSV
jgi:preprotein translocase subunit SecD